MNELRKIIMDLKTVPLNCNDMQMEFAMVLQVHDLCHARIYDQIRESQMPHLEVLLLRSRVDCFIQEASKQG